MPMTCLDELRTLPASGTRYGSVQYTPARDSAISACQIKHNVFSKPSLHCRTVLTAIAVCMGSCLGTTAVRIRTHLSHFQHCLTAARKKSLLPA